MPRGAQSIQQQQNALGDEWGQAYVAFFDDGQRAFARWVQDAIDLSYEISWFVQERLREDVAASAALGACRSTEDLIDCQRRFATKAAEQYTQEIGKLSQMMIKLASAGLSSLPSHRPSPRT